MQSGTGWFDCAAARIGSIMVPCLAVGQRSGFGRLTSTPVASDPPDPQTPPECDKGHKPREGTRNSSEFPPAPPPRTEFVSRCTPFLNRSVISGT